MKKIVFALVIAFATVLAFRTATKRPAVQHKQPVEIVPHADNAVTNTAIPARVQSEVNALLQVPTGREQSHPVNNVVDFFLPSPMTPTQQEEFQRQKDERIKLIVEKDKADHINDEVREREAKLSALSTQLVSGMSLEQSKAILGSPDLVEAIQASDGGLKYVRMDSDAVGADGTWLTTTYWPRVGVAFDGKNGQGYQVLVLLFNESHRLEKWFWQETVIWNESTRSGSEGNKYWTGKFSTSPPPPTGISWHY